MNTRAAVSLLAGGFRDNPLPTVMLGPHADRRMRRVRGCRLPYVLGHGRTKLCFVATDGSLIVGVTGIAPPGTCQPTVTQLSKMLPSLVSCGPTPLFRLGSWMRTWGSLDPSEPHTHLGPFAVDPRLRGRGIGSQILAEYFRRCLDASGLMGYLETKTEDNVRLYTRFRIHGHDSATSPRGAQLVHAARASRKPRQSQLRSKPAEDTATPRESLDLTGSRCPA